MYCKKCGRKLDDNMRFCDRCGQSVRQNQNTGKEARRREIEELKEERLNRKQKLREKEQQKKEKKQRVSKRKINVLSIGFIILFFILIIASITYILTNKQSQNAAWRTTDGSVELNESQRPTASPAPTDKNGAEITPLPTSTAYAITAELTPDGYREFQTSVGTVFPYPGIFMQQSASGGEKLHLYDKAGGGTIILGEQSPVSGAAKEIMGEYAKSVAGTVRYSRAGNGWYVVETSENDIITHRKCIISNNIAVYYDFSYSSSSAAAEEYKEHISYMDEHFDI